jgi:vibriolysin
LTLSLFACGGGSQSEPVVIPAPPPVIVPPPSNEITEVPSNQISKAYFRDQDSAAEKIAGTIIVRAPSVIVSANDRSESVWVYWADEQGEKFGDAWLTTNADAIYDIVIPQGTNIPQNIHQLLLYPSNKVGLSAQGSLVSFHDFTGNAELAGAGGNESQS